MKKIHTSRYLPEGILFVVLLLFMSSMVLTGCASEEILGNNDVIGSKTIAAYQQSTKAQSPEYVFRSGDQLRITIRGYSEFDTTVTVADDGTISMRLIGEFSAGESTREQLIKVIKSKLAVYIKTAVEPTITLMNSLEQKVIVLGTVARQDNFAVSGEVSILQILAMAGGTTVDSDIHHIKIFRNGDSVSAEEIDITKYLSNGNIMDMPTVRPGDTVYVPREENIVRELSSFFRDTIFLFTLFTISK